jgi:hypothetical protein
MNRTDRAILWLADRVPVSLIFLVPVCLGLTCAEESLARVARLSMQWWVFAALGFGHGYLAVRLAQGWYRHHGLRQCTDCFRIGRWSTRVTCRADDSLAIPEPPPSWQGGCWCQRHAMVHLLRLIGPYHSEVSLVPYDRNWGRLVMEDRERRGV